MSKKRETNMVLRLFFIFFIFQFSLCSFGQDTIILGSKYPFKSLEDYFGKASRFDFDLESYFPKIIMKNNGLYLVENHFSNCSYSFEISSDLEDANCIEFGDNVGFLQNTWTDYPIVFIDGKGHSTFEIIQNRIKPEISINVSKSLLKLKREFFAENTLSFYWLGNLILVRDQFGQDNFVLFIAGGVQKHVRLESHNEEFLGCSSDYCFSGSQTLVRRLDLNGTTLDTCFLENGANTINYPFFDFDKQKVMVGSFDPVNWSINVGILSF